jgi:inner membrane transporter RhtA
MSVQFGAAYAATLFDELGPGGTAFLRLALAAVILVAVWRPRVRGQSAADLRTAALFGVSLGAMNWSYYESLDRIPLGAAVTFESVGPLAVAVAGSRRPLDVAWVVLALAGVVLLGNPFGGGGLDPVGIALAFLAGTCWAAYILLSVRTGQAFPGGHGLAIAMVVGAVFTLPAGVVQGGGDLLVPELLAAALAVALACSVIPYSLELEALRRLPASLFGVLMSLEPAMASVAGFLILSQELAARELLAIALVVVASAGAALNARGPVPVEV